MLFKAVLKSLVILFVLCAHANISTAVAQDDPNSQHVVILTGFLSEEPREIEVPVEVGVLRLQFTVQFTDQLDLKLVSPIGRLVDSAEPNISIIATRNRRSISMWDPKPGKWKMVLTGKGNFFASATAQGELYVCCMQFFGRNGVYMLDRLQPMHGSEQQAQVYVSGFNLETIDFQMINDHGAPIAPIKFRQTDYSNPSAFTLLIKIPEIPFRIMAGGRDTNGKDYQRVFGWLIQPQVVEPVDAQTENSPNQQSAATPWQDVIKSAREGSQAVIRASVVKWSDEPLLSEKGNTIGVRLKYSMKFPVEGAFSPYPQVYPERIGMGYTGALGMHIHRSSVDPPPEGAPNQNQLNHTARAVFKTGVVYNFTIDLIPNYLGYDEDRKTFCTQIRLYNQPGIRERFEREVMGAVRLRYRFSLGGTDLDGRQPSLTENSYVPQSWLQSYRKEGFKECK